MKVISCLIFHTQHTRTHTHTGNQTRMDLPKLAYHVPRTDDILSPGGGGGGGGKKKKKKF